MTRQVTIIVCYPDSIPGKAKIDPEGIASAAILTHSLAGGVKIANQLSLTDSGLSRTLLRSPKYCKGVLEFCRHLQKVISIQPLLEANFNKLIISLRAFLFPGIEPGPVLARNLIIFSYVKKLKVMLMNIE